MFQDQKLSPDKIYKQAKKTKGYIYKKSRGLIQQWQKRYFIILNDSLMYYDDEALEKRKGTIDIREIINITLDEDCEFTLECQKRNYKMKCESQNERDLWVASLRIINDHIVTLDPIIKQETSKALQAHIFAAISKGNINKSDANYKTQLALIKRVCLMMGLKHLAVFAQEQLWAYNRIACFKNIDGYFIVISIKSLEITQPDEQILEQKYIEPFSFNRLYQVISKNPESRQSNTSEAPSAKVEEIGKMSQMQFCKMEKQYVLILFNDEKQVRIPIKKELEAHEITRKLRRAYEVGRQYYNPQKIKLQVNIDLLIFFYDKDLKLFEKHVQNKINKKFKGYLKDFVNSSSKFIDILQSIKKNVVQIDDAFKLKTPYREDTKNYFLRVMHSTLSQQVAEGWKNLFSTFSPQQLISLSTWVYEYSIIVRPTINENKLSQGITDIIRIYLRKKTENIKSLIDSLKISKIQAKKTKNQLLQNQMTNCFYEWLVQLTGVLTESVLQQSIFEEYCSFFCKVFNQFCEYVSECSEQWNEVSLVIGACNDFSRITNYFQRETVSGLCRGPGVKVKFNTLCGEKVRNQVKACLSTLILRIFILTFSSIDRKILNRSFLQLDIGKICYQVLQRLQPYKNKVDEYVQNKITLQSFDQICFFLFTNIIKKPPRTIPGSNEPDHPSVKKHYVLTLERTVKEIEQYYCNIKTQSKVKPHLKELLVLKNFIEGESVLIRSCCKQLRKTFGYSLNQQAIINLLLIRESDQNKISLYLNQCLEELKNSTSSQSSKIDTISLQSYWNDHARPRKSTLSFSPEKYPKMAIEMSSYSLAGKQGYLLKKKISTNQSTIYEQSYFKIAQKKLLEYGTKQSTIIVDVIDLKTVEKCMIDENKGASFIVALPEGKYKFKANNRDQAGKWVQAIYSQMGRPIFENKMSAKMLNPSEKMSQNQPIFKDYENESPTTDTIKGKNRLNYNNEKAQSLAKMEIKQRKNNEEWEKQKEKEKNKEKVEDSKNEKKIKPKKELDKSEILIRSKNNRNSEEGATCCSGKFF